ncbi:hypothetical protein EG348_01280 [Chryseobacterium sp. G0201]|nr:hypothetical protein EG348_01280 [Chryseobacterium sp. G0201]
MLRFCRTIFVLNTKITKVFFKIIENIFVGKGVSFSKVYCHCEEQSDEAIFFITNFFMRLLHIRFAMTGTIEKAINTLAPIAVKILF